MDIDFDVINRNHRFCTNIFSCEECVNYDDCASWNWRGRVDTEIFPCCFGGEEGVGESGMISFIVYLQLSMQAVKKFSSMISNTFFCACRSRVGDRNPFPDGFCLFCRRRNLFVVELPGDYRQVGDVPLLKFFCRRRRAGRPQKDVLGSR